MLTLRPASLALAEIGPHVFALTLVHIHTGSPTRPVPAGSGAIWMSAPSRRIEAMARRASCSGDTCATAPSATQTIVCIPPYGEMQLRWYQAPGTGAPAGGPVVGPI